MKTLQVLNIACLFLAGLLNFALSAELQILSSSGTNAHRLHPTTVIENAYDKSGSTDRANCYLSGRGENGEPPSATFQIAQSIVQNVQLLNRNDGYYFQQNGLKVEVCSVYDICEVCGEVQGANQGMWTTLTCPQGLSGNRVKAVHTNPMLTVDICEIIINGESAVIEPAVKPLEPAVRPVEPAIQPPIAIEPAVQPRPAVLPAVEPVPVTQMTAENEDYDYEASVASAGTEEGGSTSNGNRRNRKRGNRRGRKNRRNRNRNKGGRKN